MTDQPLPDEELDEILEELRLCPNGRPACTTCEDAKAEAKSALQAYTNRAVQKALQHERAMRLSDISRAVGILEGLGHPDEYLIRQRESISKEYLGGDKP